MVCGKGGYFVVFDEFECCSMDNVFFCCQFFIQNCYDFGSVWSCVFVFIYCNNVFIGFYQWIGQNVYDICGKCEDSSNFCYSVFGWISDYFNQ